MWLDLIWAIGIVILAIIWIHQFHNSHHSEDP
jgi:hypothetical protein